MMFRPSLEKLCDRRLFAADLASAFEQHPFVCEFPAPEVSMFNAAKPADVDRNGAINPVDALRIIDTLNRFGAVSVQEFSRQNTSLSASKLNGAEGEKGDESAQPFASLDANNDGSINPIDVLVVIDALNEVPVPMMIEGQTEIVEAVAYDAVAYEMVGTESQDITEEDPWKVTGLPDGAWVRYGSESEDEFPYFYSEMQQAVPLVELSDEQDLMFVTMNSNSEPVPVFSQQGLLYQVLETQAQQGQELANGNAASAVSYFSSNFLKSRS